MNVLAPFKRIAFDLLLFAVIIGFFLARGYWFTIENGALDLLLYKMMLVSGGFVHAHILRKLAFSYIDFRDNNKMHQAMIIGLYLTIIWSYARGG
jgi:hypothetical protein